MKTQITPIAISYLNKEVVQDKISKLLGSQELARSYITSACQLMSDPDVAERFSRVTSESVYGALSLTATLNLPIQKSLGFAYIIPYGNMAQFQIGYKGLIQLALRTGQYKRLTGVKIYKENLISRDPINGTKFNWDYEPYDNEKPIGFFSYLRLNSGFEAELYMSYDQVDRHGKKYSKNYNYPKSLWQDKSPDGGFEKMALKTVLKLLLNKYGILSTEMQKAIENDQAVVIENEPPLYVDNPNTNTQEAEYVELSVDNETFQKLKLSVKSGAETLENINANFELSGEQQAELIKIGRGQ